MTLTALFLGPFLLAQATDPEKVTLVRKVSRGDTFSFSLRTDYEIGEVKGTSLATVTDRVLGVDDEGNVSIESKGTQGKTILNGVERQSSDSSYTTVTDKRNLILTVFGDRLGSDGMRFSRLMMVVFPAEPVVLGGSWVAEIPSDPGRTLPGLKLTYTLLARETVEGLKSVKISAKSREEGDGSPPSAEGTFWLEEATGVLVKSEARLLNIPLGSRRFNAKVTQVRRPAP
ncbi:MAG: hypothetical protein MUC92_10985 [Fimbriimonadaceae bacterium]|jgi:hypothetical protein|nr:hypothetical protein [Fimbriimonadaceae bacterium]